MSPELTIVGWALSAVGIITSGVFGVLLWLAKERAEKAKAVAADGECVRCAVIAAERDAAHRRADDAAASAEKRHAEVVTISTTAHDAMVSTAAQIERLVGAVGTLASEVRDLAREQRR